MLKPSMPSLCSKVAAAAMSGALLAAAPSTFAATWSDTAISWRHGDKFAEPYGSNDITKNIFALTHISGYAYGTNFFNVDLLQSDNKDPASQNPGTSGSSGAQEAYIVYRHTLSLGAVTKSKFAYGPVKDMGITAGFDWNTKNDAGYSSKKRMLVGGVTFMIDVPGFWNVDVLALKESNAPLGHPQRYTYDTHGMLATEWGIPIGTLPLSFEGFALYIGSKGKDEFGNLTKPETNVDMQVMLDVGKVLGGPVKTFKAGLEYQYWKNKFGNPTTAPGQGAGPGATAKTPMVRVEYHF